MNIAKDKRENAKVRVHIDEVLTACESVQEYSSRISSALSSELSKIPSGTSPTSSGSFLTKSIESGVTTLMHITARIIQAPCQLYLSMKIWVKGTKTTAPTEIPTAEKASALPRSLINHFVIGTEVTKDPGPFIPINPMTAKATIKCNSV